MEFWERGMDLSLPTLPKFETLVKFRVITLVENETKINSTLLPYPVK